MAGEDADEGVQRLQGAARPELEGLVAASQPRRGQRAGSSYPAKERPMAASWRLAPPKVFSSCLTHKK